MKFVSVFSFVPLKEHPVDVQTIVVYILMSIPVIFFANGLAFMIRNNCRCPSYNMCRCLMLFVNLFILLQKKFVGHMKRTCKVTFSGPLSNYQLCSCCKDLEKEDDNVDYGTYYSTDGDKWADVTEVKSQIKH